MISLPKLWVIQFQKTTDTQKKRSCLEERSSINYKVCHVHAFEFSRRNVTWKIEECVRRKKDKDCKEVSRTEDWRLQSRNTKSPHLASTGNKSLASIVANEIIFQYELIIMLNINKTWCTWTYFTTKCIKFLTTWRSLNSNLEMGLNGY